MRPPRTEVWANIRLALASPALRPEARLCRRSSERRCVRNNNNHNVKQIWCPKGDSNPHDLSRYHLKVVRLPIPPSGHGGFVTVATKPANYISVKAYLLPCSTGFAASLFSGAAGAAGVAASGAAGTLVDGTVTPVFSLPGNNEGA